MGIVTPSLFLAAEAGRQAAVDASMEKLLEAQKGSDHLGILTACIKALISESIKVAPTLYRPVFSSSNVLYDHYCQCQAF
jgi:hypothetical protein